MIDRIYRVRGRRQMTPGFCLGQLRCIDGSTSHRVKESWRKSKFEVHGRDLEFSFGCIEFYMPVRLKEKLFDCLLCV